MESIEREPAQAAGDVSTEKQQSNETEQDGNEQAEEEMVRDQL